MNTFIIDSQKPKNMGLMPEYILFLFKLPEFNSTPVNEVWVRKN